MANEKLTVGELVYKISGDLDNLKTELKKADTEIGKLKESMEKTSKTTGGMLANFNLLKAAVVGFVSGALVRGTIEIAKSGAELDSLSQSFQRLSGEMGLSSNEILSTLQEMSAGTIANRDLVVSANRAMVLGVAKDIDEFSTLMQVARIRAADMGITTTQAFDNIVTGIGRGSPLILDNLGIIVKQQEAYEKYAASLGKTAEQLTANEQREALKFAVMDDARRQIENVGEVTLSYAERMQQASAWAQNLRDRIGLALLPAMEVLVSNMIDTNATSEETAANMNVLGREFYRVANILVVVGRSFKTLGGVVRIAFNGIQNTFIAGAQVILSGARAVAVALDKDTTLIDDAMISLADSFDKNLDDISDAFGDMEENGEKFNHALSQALNPDEYKGISAEMVDQMKAINNSLGEEEGIAGAADDAAEKIEAFQGKLVSLVSSASDARAKLEGELTDAFKKFGDSLGSNVNETVQSLAQIVIGAEDKIKELKKQLRDTDDADERRSIKDQIKEQQDILKTREDFEERQAARITAIREKLTEAGIDAEKAGLDSVLNLRTLEEQIEEDRRIASLNEFQRFEEEQAKKLLLLTDSFITETSLLQEKIETQKSYEADLTAYLQSEDSKRLENTDAWATQTIAKYKQVADSLQNLLSTQARIQNLQVGSISPIPTQSVPQSAPQSGTTTNNTTNNNVTAPVTINGQAVQNLSAKEISAILGFELNKFIR